MLIGSGCTAPEPDVSTDGRPIEASQQSCCNASSCLFLLLSYGPCPLALKSLGDFFMLLRDTIDESKQGWIIRINRNPE